MKILFLSRWYPYPPVNGSKLRIYHLLRGLARYHQVSLISFVDPSGPAADLAAMQHLCREVRLVPWTGFNPVSRRARLGFFSFTPRSVLDTFSAEMQGQLEQALTTGNYDLVIASQVDMAGYARFFNGTPALFEEVEVAVLYEQFAHAQTWLDRLRYGLTWAKHRRYLARLMRRFNRCTVVSEQERRLAAPLAADPQRVAVVPNCLNLADYTAPAPAKEAHTLIFTGAFSYFANHEAMVWFVGQVLPRIQAALPQARLIITGDPAGLPLPPAEGITQTGFVDDVRPLVAAAAVSLAPLWQGGGTRLKILEAMALRTPVVATSKGAEGLDAVAGQHLLVADTPETYAEAVVRLLSEPALARQLTDNAYDLVRRRYDWAAAMPQFLQLVEASAAGR